MNHRGMTLIELMTVIAITSIALLAISSTFIAQQKSYIAEGEITEIQETGQTALTMLKRDMMMAGYGVDKKLAFYIEDGGNNAPDKIYINDGEFIDEDKLLSGIYGQTSFTGSGTAITVDSLDIDNDGDNEFQGGIWQCIITNTDDPSKKVAKISNINGNQVNLDRAVEGSQVAPAIYYCVDEDILRRSDRSSGGRQPLASNIVDLQVAYRDKDGYWYGVSGCNGSGLGDGFCTRNPFDPEEITLIRLSLVVCSEKKVERARGTGRPAVENRNGGAADDFIYRVLTLEVRPRNTML